MENIELLASEERENKKNKLQSAINDITASLNNQLDDKKELGRKVLIAGGIVLAGYAISRLLISSDTDEEIETAKPTKNSDSNSLVGGVLKGVATSLLLSLAKSKLEKVIADLTTSSDEPAPTA